MGLLPDTENCSLRVRWECRKRVPHHRLQRKPLISYRHASRHVRHVRAVMHVGIANPRWRGKRSRHSGCMRNPRFYVSGKRPHEQRINPHLSTMTSWDGKAYWPCGRGIHRFIPLAKGPAMHWCFNCWTRSRVTGDFIRHYAPVKSLLWWLEIRLWIQLSSWFTGAGNACNRKTYTIPWSVSRQRGQFRHLGLKNNLCGQKQFIFI